MGIVIVVPVLNRPHRVEPLLESIAAATPAPYRVLFVTTRGDVDELAAIEAAGAESICVGVRRPGDYARKINLGLRSSTEELIFTGADDLVFHRGWLEAAVARLAPGVGVVGTNDLGNADVLAGRHATHSVVTREYAMERGCFDRPGLIYHEQYDHNYCDVEMIETAKARQAFVFAEDSVVEHVHPSWAKADFDPVYELGRARFREDGRLWQRRRQQMHRAGLGR